MDEARWSPVVSDDARTRMLSAVRSALGRGPLPEDRRAEIDRRLADPQANVVPMRGQVADNKRIDLFRAEAERVAATTEQLSNPAEIPAAIARLLRGRNLPMVVKAAPDPALAAIPWDSEPALTVTSGGAADGDAVTVTAAIAGVAETGTVIMESSAGSPVLLSFLPALHIVVVRESDIVGTYEEVWRWLRTKHGPGRLPRGINWVTGPSRTADIEQTLLLGAHGPRDLHILLVGD